jgi:hypothetical protein
MMHKATEATTQDVRLSTEEEGECSIKCEPGFLLLQSAEDSTTRAVGRAAPHIALQRSGCAHRSREYAGNDAELI